MSCNHQNGYETIQDNAIFYYKCWDCKQIIGGTSARFANGAD